MERLNYGEVAKTVLKVIGVAGAIAVVAVAPGAVKIFTPTKRSRSRSPKPRQINQALERLKTAGMVETFIRDGKEQVQLSKDGHRLVSALQAQEFLLKQPKTWDGFWRIVSFDVREDRKRLRDRLRHWLSGNGFVRLQDSVWIYPYECETVVELLRSALRMRGECLYLTCKRFTNDRWLARQFKLKEKQKKNLITFIRGRG